MLAYALTSRGPSVATEETRLLKEEAYEHHRDDRVVGGPITTLFSYANTAACNQSEFVFLQIVGGQKVETAMALPHLLIPECKKETYAVPEQADVLAE